MSTNKNLRNAIKFKIKHSSKKVITMLCYFSTVILSSILEQNILFLNIIEEKQYKQRFEEKYAEVA